MDEQWFIHDAVEATEFDHPISICFVDLLKAYRFVSWVAL